eukprot:gene5845-biopygen7216
MNLKDKLLKLPTTTNQLLRLNSHYDCYHWYCHQFYHSRSCRVDHHHHHRYHYYYNYFNNNYFYYYYYYYNYNYYYYYYYYNYY